MKINKRFARYAKYRRCINWLRSEIWKAQMKVSSLFLKSMGIGGLQMQEGSLGIRIKRNGIWYDFGIVGHKVITTAYAEFYVDQLIAETSVFGDFKHHAIGTDSTAENITDTDLGTQVESVTAGTQVEDSSKVYKSIASIAITATRALREHGIANNAVFASGTMMDRTVFALLTLDNGDTFEATYKLSVSDGT